MKYQNYEEAIEYLACGEKIRRRQSASLFSEGIYYTDTKAFKITLYENEANACSRLIGKDFKNVCKIHHVHRNIKVAKWKVTVIEQELLQKYKGISFYHLNFEYIMRDVGGRAEMAKDIINGLVELDSVGIIYGDLHSSNIMQDSNNNLKLIDFGTAKVKRKR
jgi:hypothetical protein